MLPESYERQGFMIALSMLCDFLGIILTKILMSKQSLWNF